MDFTDKSWCQEELSRVLEITRYIQKKEIALSPVYESLAETKRQSERVTQIIKDTAKFLRDAHQNYLYLSDPQAKKPLATEALSKPSQAPQASLPGTITTSNTAADKMLPANTSSKTSVPLNPKETSSNRDIQTRNTDARRGLELKGNDIVQRRRTLKNKNNGGIKPHKKRDKLHTAAANFNKASRTRNTLRPKDSSSNIRPERSRIKHNGDYPKPWLDPPPQRVLTTTSKERRESIITRRSTLMNKSQKRRDSMIPAPRLVNPQHITLPGQQINRRRTSTMQQYNGKESIAKVRTGPSHGLRSLDRDKNSHNSLTDFTKPRADYVTTRQPRQLRTRQNHQLNVKNHTLLDRIPEL